MRLRITLAAFALAGLAAAAGADGLPGDGDRPSRQTQALRWKEAMRIAKKGDAAGPPSEAVRMLAALLKGDRVNGGGWFGPGQSRYGWGWVAGKFDDDSDGRVTRPEFTGPADLFDRLDRDGDGAITADDFDWSESAPFVKQQAQVTQVFRAIDTDADGRISAEECDEYFGGAAKDKGFLTPDDLRAALFPPAKRGDVAKGKGKGGKDKDDKKKAQVMLQAFLDGDAGSPFEGPRVGQDAPDFTLPTYDGKGKVTLSDFRGKKPVVLVFGSFT